MTRYIVSIVVAGRSESMPFELPEAAADFCRQMALVALKSDAPEDVSIEFYVEQDGK